MIGALLVVALPLPAGDASARRKAETTTVEASGGPAPFTWSWTPSDITIAKGDVVAWTNTTGVTHRVTSWDGSWEVAEHLEAGDSARIRFKQPGVYQYWCDIMGHADLIYVGTERICVGMCGTITVE